MTPNTTTRSLDDAMTSLATRAAAQAGAGREYVDGYLAGMRAIAESAVELVEQARSEGITDAIDAATAYYRPKVHASPATAIREGTAAILEALTAPRTTQKVIERDASGAIVGINEVTG